MIGVAIRWGWSQWIKGRAVAASRSVRIISSGVVAGLLAAMVATFGVARIVNATGGGTAAAFVPLTPCRLVDTRSGSDNVGARNTRLGDGETATFDVRGTNGNCAIPTSATAITGNVTVVGPAANSFLTIWPADVPRPTVSNINFTAGSAPLGNTLTVTLSADGKINVYNLSGSVDVIIDVSGYFQAVTSTSASAPAADEPVDIDVGVRPIAVFSDGTFAWVPNYASKSVSKINVATNKVVDTIRLDYPPYRAADGGAVIWASSADGDRLMKIDKASGYVSYSNPGVDLGPLAFDGENLWSAGTVTDSEGNETRLIWKFDAVSGQVVTSIPIDSSSYVFSVKFISPYLWISLGYGSSIALKMNPANGTITEVVADDIAPYSFHGLVDFTDIGTDVYAISADGALRRIDPLSNVVSEPIGQVLGSLGYWLTSDGSNLWVSGTGSDSVQKVDPTSGLALSSANTGDLPQSPYWDGTYIWVANAQSNTVTKIRSAS